MDLESDFTLPEFSPVKEEKVLLQSKVTFQKEDKKVAKMSIDVAKTLFPLIDKILEFSPSEQGVDLVVFPCTRYGDYPDQLVFKLMSPFAKNKPFCDIILWSFDMTMLIRATSDLVKQVCTISSSLTYTLKATEHKSMYTARLHTSHTAFFNKPFGKGVAKCNLNAFHFLHVRFELKTNKKAFQNPVFPTTGKNIIIFNL